MSLGPGVCKGDWSPVPHILHKEAVINLYIHIVSSLPQNSSVIVRYMNTEAGFACCPLPS